MSKSDEFREMQISSGQLAAVILALLALCVFIFYLGTRVGMNKAAASSPAASSGAAASSGTKTIPTTKLAPSIAELAGEIQKPAGTTPAPATETEKPPASKTTSSKPVETKPAGKTEPKPAAAADKPAVIELKPKTSQGAKAPAPSASYYIQAGALDTRPKAENLAQKIEGLGFRAIALNPFAADKKPVYRVRVGPYESKEAAEAARGKLAEVLKRKASDFFLVKG